MSELFDDISRIVGSPIPRRHALKAIGGALLGAVFTTSIYRKVSSAQVFSRCCRSTGGTCYFGETPQACDPRIYTKDKCVALGFEWREGHSCCPDGHTCPAGEICCGATCCGGSNPVCFEGACCTDERVCGNFSFCCPSGFVCSQSTQQCCPTAQYCPGSQTCCPNGTICVNEMCCPTASVCTDPFTNQTICCSSGSCCGGTKCCPNGCTSDGLNCRSTTFSPSR